MVAIRPIGLDLAQHVFQVHGLPQMGECKRASCAASYVKAYVKRGKTADAEAICEAVTRPTSASWPSSRWTSRPP